MEATGASPWAATTKVGPRFEVAVDGFSDLEVESDELEEGKEMGTS